MFIRNLGNADADLFVSGAELRLRRVRAVVDGRPAALISHDVFLQTFGSCAGAETVTYEGIRCAASEVKTYATARPDRSWSVHPGAWRRIEARSVQRWHYVLWEEFFCPRRLAIRSNAEGVNALKRGGHPDRIAVPARGY